MWFNVPAVDCDHFYLIPFNFSLYNQPFKLFDTK